MRSQSLQSVETILGGLEASHLRSVRADQLLEIDRRLAAGSESTAPPPLDPTEYRIFVPIASLDDPWELKAAILFGHSVAIPDPIDAVFADPALLAMAAGAATSRTGLGPGATATALRAGLKEHRRRLLEKILSSDDAARRLGLMLQRAVEFHFEWSEAIAAGYLLPTSALRAGDGLAATLAFGNLPTTAPFVSADAVQQLLKIGWRGFDDDLYRLNMRLALANAAGAQILAHSDFDWRVIRAGLAAVRTSRGTAPAAAQMMLEVNLTLPRIKTSTLLTIRADEPAFEDWRTGLRRVARSMPDPADYTTSRAAAAELLSDELVPRIRAIESDTWLGRVKGDIPRESIALTMCLAGLGSLSSLTHVSTASFAGLPIAVASRLIAIGALGKGARRSDSILAKLVRDQ